MTIRVDPVDNRVSTEIAQAFLGFLNLFCLHGVTIREPRVQVHNLEAILGLENTRLKLLVQEIRMVEGYDLSEVIDIPFETFLCPFLLRDLARTQTSQ